MPVCSAAWAQFIGYYMIPCGQTQWIQAACVCPLALSPTPSGCHSPLMMRPFPRTRRVTALRAVPVSPCMVTSCLCTLRVVPVSPCMVPALSSCLCTLRVVPAAALSAHHSFRPSSTAAAVIPVHCFSPLQRSELCYVQKRERGALALCNSRRLPDTVCTCMFRLAAAGWCRAGPCFLYYCNSPTIIFNFKCL